MKQPANLTILIVLGVCITFALPILAAIALTQHQAAEREQAYVMQFARSVLRQSDRTGDQLAAGARHIAKLDRQRACSSRGLRLMRQIDLGSTLLQAVGYMEGNSMVCSSIEGMNPINLGPTTHRSRNGTLFRSDVQMGGDTDASFLAVQKGAFVGIVHKQLALSFIGDVPGLSTAIISWSTRAPIVTKDDPNPEWFRHEATGNAIFRDGNHLIALVRSKRYDSAAIAAVPLVSPSPFVREAAGVLIPIAIAASAALSYLFIFVIRTRTSMPTMIRSALRSGSFFVAYQPVIDLATGRTIGAEALIRWHRGSDEIIPPDVFIPIAEEADLMPLLTARMLELVADDAGHLLRISPCFHIAVNFSPADLHNENVVQRVEAFLTRSGMSSRNLVIEITEQSILDVGRTKNVIQELREAGVQIAIDDFGTGYSSLRYLAELQIDILKIDKSFVQSLSTDSATSQVAGRIIDMAKDLDLKIVAEGVETPQQELVLETLKVDYAQGYLLGSPMEINDFLPWLRAQKRRFPTPPNEQPSAGAGAARKTKRLLKAV